MTRKHILLCILDWGLGHAGRCVPLIEQLVANGYDVSVATSGIALPFLRASTTMTKHYLELPSYAIRYPTRNMFVNLAIQGPRIATVIYREHRLVTAFIKQHQVDTIVSDGRFGCYSPTVKSIWMAHQLQIQHPTPLVAASMNAAYHRYIKLRYQSIWVPDWSGDNALAGQLSQAIRGIPHRYLGALSRYRQHDRPIPITYKYVVLLSGPEPQRSKLEQELLVLLQQQTAPSLLIRGCVGSTNLQQVHQQIEVVDWLLGDKLEHYIQQAETVICRSGYSTLMDLHYWQKPAILIPTPGQTEQEYLAQYWASEGKAQHQKQGDIRLD